MRAIYILKLETIDSLSTINNIPEITIGINTITLKR